MCHHLIQMMTWYLLRTLWGIFHTHIMHQDCSFGITPYSLPQLPSRSLRQFNMVMSIANISSWMQWVAWLTITSFGGCLVAQQQYLISKLIKPQYVQGMQGSKGKSCGLPPACWDFGDWLQKWQGPFGYASDCTSTATNWCTNWSIFFSNENLPFLRLGSGCSSHGPSEAFQGQIPFGDICEPWLECLVLLELRCILRTNQMLWGPPPFHVFDLFTLRSSSEKNATARDFLIQNHGQALQCLEQHFNDSESETQLQWTSLSPSETSCVGVAMMSSKSRVLKAIARSGCFWFELTWTMKTHDKTISLIWINMNYENIWQNNFTLGQVGFYAAGFPCTPYSLLHNGSLLLGEEAAKPMWQCIRNFKRCQPAVTCQLFDGMLP